MSQEARYTVAEFVQQTRQDEDARGYFELESPYMLEVNLSGRVWAKAGSMIAYTGEVKFERESLRQMGFGKLLKKAVTGEASSLMHADGQGRVYFADAGKKVQILNLQNETIFVNGNDLLAFEDGGIEWDIKMMRRIATMMAGGLFNIKLTGTGMVAITTHYDPLTLLVKPDQPVFTDPNATVAWSGSLLPELKTDMTMRTFLGRGSGESFQMKFEGEGWVVMQPYEEIVYATTNG